MQNKIKLITIIILIMIIVIWEYTSINFSSIKFFISSPSESVKYFWDFFPNILKSASTTALEAFTGFTLAIIFSFIIMILCVINSSIYKFISPIFIASQVLPIITLAPLFIIIFGMGLISKIAMVILMCFFPVFINFSKGIDNISQNVHELLYIYNAKKLFIIFKVMFPLATPYIFAGLKISATMAVMGAIVSEFVGAKDGLGKNLYLAPKNTLPQLMICSIFLTALLGWLLFKLVEITEKVLGKWYLKNKIQEYETIQ